MYKPLPKSLMIKGSDIEGQGLFATEPIAAETALGITHVKAKNAENQYWRTPLGGFINHSDIPNCIKKENRFTDNLYLETIKDIDGGEELTVRYTLYELEKKNEIWRSH